MHASGSVHGRHHSAAHQRFATAPATSCHCADGGMTTHCVIAAPDAVLMIRGRWRQRLGGVSVHRLCQHLPGAATAHQNGVCGPTPRASSSQSASPPAYTSGEQARQENYRRTLPMGGCTSVLEIKHVRLSSSPNIADGEWDGTRNCWHQGNCCS